MAQAMRSRRKCGVLTGLAPSGTLDCLLRPNLRASDPCLELQHKSCVRPCMRYSQGRPYPSHLHLDSQDGSLSLSSEAVQKRRMSRDLNAPTAGAFLTRVDVAWTCFRCRILWWATAERDGEERGR